MLSLGLYETIRMSVTVLSVKIGPTTEGQDVSI